MVDERSASGRAKPQGSDWGWLPSPAGRLRSPDLLDEHLFRYSYETAASWARAKEVLREKQRTGGP